LLQEELWPTRDESERILVDRCAQERLALRRVHQRQYRWRVDPDVDTRGRPTLFGPHQTHVHRGARPVGHLAADGHRRWRLAQRRQHTIRRNEHKRRRRHASDDAPKAAPAAVRGENAHGGCEQHERRRVRSAQRSQNQQGASYERIDKHTARRAQGKQSLRGYGEHEQEQRVRENVRAPERKGEMDGCD